MIWVSDAFLQSLQAQMQDPLYMLLSAEVFMETFILEAFKHAAVTSCVLCVQQN